MAAVSGYTRKSLADVQTEKMSWAVNVIPPKHIVPVYRLPVSTFGAVLAPAFGPANQALILTYTVRANWAVLITGIVLGYQGGPPAPLPGDIFWTVDIDRPLGSSAGYDEKDYAGIGTPVGSLVGGPVWPVEFFHRDGEVIRVKAQTVQNVATGPGNFVTAFLIGYEWPEGSE